MDSMGHTVSATAAGLCCPSTKGARDDTPMDACGYAPIQLDLWTQKREVHFTPFLHVVRCDRSFFPFFSNPLNA